MQHIQHSFVLLPIFHTENREIFVFYQPLHNIGGRRANMEFQKIIWKKKAFIVADCGLFHQMYDVFVDKNTASCVQYRARVQRYNLICAGQHIDELQILMPVHDLKARVAGIAVSVDDIQYEIGESGALIEVDRADEIWSDLTLFGSRHIPMQSVSEDAKRRTAAFYSPSKTFNLAGLVGSYHIVYNDAVREQLRVYEARGHYNDMNVLSMQALTGAYTPEGRAWMEQLKRVLEANIELACSFFQNTVRGVSLHRPEETYMIVPDFAEWCRAHGKTQDGLLRAGVKVGVLWRNGRQFHIPCGIRMALGLPTGKLEEALYRLKQYVL